VSREVSAAWAGLQKMGRAGAIWQNDLKGREKLICLELAVFPHVLFWRYSIFRPKRRASWLP
jgi:hypothetical protein